MRVRGSGFMVQGSGFRVQGSWFRVQGWGVHLGVGPWGGGPDSGAEGAAGRLPYVAHLVWSNESVARPVHLIITMIKWIRTSRLSIQNQTVARRGPQDDSRTFRT